MLRVRLLGAVAVERDGKPVSLPGSTRRLLVFLALHPGPHDRDALAARFWPDVPQPAGRASLRTAVWVLRRALGEDALAASRSTVGLCPEALWVDVAEVAALAAAGQDRLAVEQCRGELLADVDEDWARTVRAEHQSRHVGLLDRLAERAETDGDAAAAVRWSRLRCALTPLDEPAHCALLRRLAIAGDRAGALATGRAFGQRLRAELGVAPGPSIRAVLAQLRGPTTAAGASPDDAIRPLFGRTRELAALTTAWSAAREGHGQVVVVTGEGGIGKTRLITELARRADNAGGRVAVGAGVDVGGEAPFAVWQELTRQLVCTVPAPPEHTSWPQELGRLAPDLATGLGRTGLPPPVSAPELERLRIFDGALRLVEWAAAGRPVLLVAEDVHRADRASLQLTTHIGRRLARLPVMLVLTRRDRPVRPEADALVADLAGRGVKVSEVQLGPLDDRELAAVVCSVAPLADDDIQRAVAAAEGNPLLAVESARALAAGSTVLPSSLRTTVRAALSALPRGGRELAEAIAVAGRGLTTGEIAALDLPDRAEAERHVLDCGLVRRERGSLRFRHALLAEAARADLLDPERCHERLALALAVEAAAGTSSDHIAAEVARHLQQAGRPDLAGSRWQQAGRHARTVGALPEAATFWAEAVACAPTDPGARLELAEVYAWLGRHDDFEREWQTAVETISAADSAAAWCQRGRLLRGVICHPAASLAAYQRAQQLMPPDAPAPLRAETLLGLAWTQAVAGDASAVTGLLAQVAALEPEPDDLSYGDREHVRLFALIRLGRFDECVPVAETAGTAIERADRPDLAYSIWVNAACALACAGDLPTALRLADRAVAATRGIPVITLTCLAARTHLLSRLGRHDEALAISVRQRQMAERLDSPALIALARYDAGLVALAAGRHGEAADLLATALDEHAQISRPAARLARAEALAQDGDPEAATAEIRLAALEPVGSGDQPWSLVPRMARAQGLVALARGDRAEARRRLTEAATGWRRLRRPQLGQEYTANLVDLGRAPVVGLVEPDRELARLTTELASIDAEINTQIDTKESRCPNSP
jgi:DNA-binding SARP family transcriptional activator/tetratricopeptide (TPR) repeat protein